MVFIRPVKLSDLDPLQALAAEAGVGLTTLPNDPDILLRRIKKSLRSMEQIPDRPGGETYLFVMEDVATGNVVGASGIVSKVGGFEPFYAYKIETQIAKSKELKVRKEVQVLHLVRQHNGPAEIGSLYLSPAFRGGDNGRLLQLSRFLFLAEHRDAFEPTVVSELRGVIDSKGRSAFWDALGRHFFDCEFRQADHLSVVSKKFIADLMPRHPIYIPLLPKEAQEAIGQVHESSKPALKNLEREGFHLSGMVDIFDAGPCVSCKRDKIRTVRDSQVAMVTEVSKEAISSPAYLVGRNGGDTFRACATALSIGETGVRLHAQAADALNISPGGTVRYSLLRPESTKTT
jgi:arginine N-succinyltransferase